MRDGGRQQTRTTKVGHDGFESKHHKKRLSKKRNVHSKMTTIKENKFLDNILVAVVIILV